MAFVSAVIMFFSALVLFGCAGKTVEKDPFFEKWSALAEAKTGSSPVAVKREASMLEELIPAEKTGGDGLKTETVRELPAQSVSLKFRQADVKSVLRSLARIVEKNILVKSEIKGEITADFDNVPWSQAFSSILNAQGLAYIWEGDIIRILTMSDMEQDLKRKTQEQGIQWVEPLLTVVVPIRYIASDKLALLKGNIETFLTLNKEGKPRGSVQVNEYSNSLIISAIRSDLLRMMPIIDKIDRPTPQIHIRANIIETTKDTARNLGIQWGGAYTHYGGNNLYVTPGGTAGSSIPPGSASSGAYKPAYGAAGMSGLGYGVNFPVSDSAMSTAGGAASLGLMFGLIGGNILDIQLSALQKDGKLNILSSPSITTMDNQKAFTENGEKVPFVTTDKDGNREVKFEDAVLRLEITPHVIDESYLSMKILVKKDEVDTSRTVDGNPFIIKKQTETQLIVQDGETIVISGLTKQRGMDSESGVPWLKDVPVLGWIFKGQGKSESMEDVLIFITPKILPPAVVAVKAEQTKNTDKAPQP
jgi:type IV pilus assembly protein PilQ